MMLVIAILTAFAPLIIIFRKLCGHIKAGWLELLPTLVVLLISALVFLWIAFRMSADV
jgi:hypothetical protein